MYPLHREMKRTLKKGGIDVKVVLNSRGVLRITDDEGRTLIDRIDSEMRYPGDKYDTLYIKRQGV